MVVMSVALTTKNKTLIARQFIEITRLKIESILSVFIKLVEKGGKDHTFIETENFRYIYRPMEELFLVIITNKQSNILEDLETLKLFAQIVQDSCDVAINEDSILENAFDIIFAFDEVVSFGYRECVTLNQIKAYTEMDSHEEKFQNRILQNKEDEERERRNQILIQIDKEKTKQSKENKINATTDILASEMQKLFASSNLNDAGTFDDLSLNDYCDKNINNMRIDDYMSGVPSKGMQLGKKKPIIESIGRLELSANNSTDNTLLQLDEDTNLNPISVSIEEKILGNLQLDGTINKLDIQGTLQCTVFDASQADLALFKITPESKLFRYKAHPFLDKQSLISNNVLKLKDLDHPYKPRVPFPLLKWRLDSKDESHMPLSLSCWPSSIKDTVILVIELELTNLDWPLENVHLQFMCPGSFDPKVINVNGGCTKHDDVTLHWLIPMMDKDNSSGTLEFSVKSTLSTIAPFTLEATSHKTLCDIEVLECYHQVTEKKIDYDLTRSLNYTFTVEE